MFTLAHFSDPHLRLPVLHKPLELLNKRLLGYLSWRKKRHDIHRTEVLEALIRDLKAQAHDHLALTGDVLNISLPTEFEASARWLEDLGGPGRITVVPGNHDAYIKTDWGHSWGCWAAYMAGSREDGAERPPADFGDFPFVRRLDGIALVGVSSARPMLPFSAAGVVGSDQLARLEQSLAALGREGLCRVVLIHHPPLPGQEVWRKCLRDAAGFIEVVARAGAELVIHGHAHKTSFETLETPGGPIPVVGVASASAYPVHGMEPARYHLYSIDGGPGDWKIRVRGRAYEAQGGTFAEVDAPEYKTELKISNSV